VGQNRPNSDDLDAPTMFPLATDPYYQNLLCEFSGMLAVAAHAARIHPQEWIGFQSWRAVDKRVRRFIYFCERGRFLLLNA
jgi:hypothetical protein